MLVKVLKDDFTIDFREYGKIKVPIGTMTSHKTPPTVIIRNITSYVSLTG